MKISVTASHWKGLCVLPHAYVRLRYCVRASGAATLAALLLGAMLSGGNAWADEPLVFGTSGDGNLAVVMREPGVGLPAPAQASIVLPSDASPHGVDFLTTDEILVADFNAPRVFRVRASTAQLIGTIALPGRTFANGSLAVARDASVAISAGEATENGPGEVVVIRPPWGAGAQVTPLTLPGRVRSFSTQTIAFAQSGRAFICHTTGISAYDPPYTAAAFTLTLPSTFGVVCVLSRDDQRLFVTRPGIRRIEVFSAPITSSSISTPISYPTDAGNDLGPIVVSPDRQQLLIGQIFRRANQSGPDARVWIVNALPTTPAFEALTLPATVSGNGCQGSSTLCPGFEDATLSADGGLAVFTGQSVFSASSPGRAPALFIRNPFNPSTREMFAVTIGDVAGGTQGRGAGAARFVPVHAAIFTDGFEGQ